MKPLQTFICVAVLGLMGFQSIAHISVPDHALTEAEMKKLLTGKILIERKVQVTRSRFDQFSKTYPQHLQLGADGTARHVAEDWVIDPIAKTPYPHPMSWYVGRFFCIRSFSNDSDRCYSIFREGDLYRFEYRGGAWGFPEDTRFSEQYWFAIVQ